MKRVEPSKAIQLPLLSGQLWLDCGRKVLCLSFRQDCLQGESVGLNCLNCGLCRLERTSLACAGCVQTRGHTLRCDQGWSVELQPPAVLPVFLIISIIWEESSFVDQRVVTC